MQIMVVTIYVWSIACYTIRVHTYVTIICFHRSRAARSKGPAEQEVAVLLPSFSSAASRHGCSCLRRNELVIPVACRDHIGVRLISAVSASRFTVYQSWWFWLYNLAVPNLQSGLAIHSSCWCLRIWRGEWTAIGTHGSFNSPGGLDGPVVAGTFCFQLKVLEDSKFPVSHALTWCGRIDKGVYISKYS